MRITMHNYFEGNRDTFIKFAWRSFQVFGKQGITFIVFILCAKMLNSYDFGVYNYILAILYLLILFGDLGISTATSKFVAEYSVVSPAKLRSVLCGSGAIVLILTLVTALITFVVGPIYLKEKYALLLYVLPLIFLVPISSLYDGIYRGLERFKELAVINNCVGLISLFVVYFLISNYGLIGALLAQDVFYALLLIILAARYRDFDFLINREVVKEIGMYSILIGISVLGQFLYTRVDVVLLGHFGYINEISYYEVINKIYQLVVLPIMVFATVVAPNTAKKYAQKKIDEIKIKIAKEIKALFALGVIVAAALYFLSPTFFGLFLPEYDLELLRYTLLFILVIVPFRLPSTLVGIGYITPMGFVKITTVTLVAFGVINLSLDCMLIPKFGYVGAIYATLISQIGYIFSNGLMFYLKLNNRKS